eukprot:SAG31_NODE_752_length_12351_cov_14.467516_7_plen_79_part_00
MPRSSEGLALSKSSTQQGLELYRIWVHLRQVRKGLYSDGLTFASDGGPARYGRSLMDGVFNAVYTHIYASALLFEKNI